MRLRDELPVDHRLGRVYRYGAGVAGLLLLIWGCFGLAGAPGFLDTQGNNVAGMSSNGALGVLSVVFGAILMIGAVIGGNIASWINMVVGLIFFVAGFVGLAALDSGWNHLAFRMANVLFSFVFGLVIATFGMYGRVSGRLPHDNPYWRERHGGDPREEEEIAGRWHVPAFKTVLKPTVHH
ncbi:DUF4383 domain-containing protein [Streptomyces tateyamensis]|uniref:DUF4383 domain-containing protein n=1 Tax=Streptomyces tateyamensis TaxID=565073 RepID=A0A2V4NB56_9ACTN|nr:DUF4383 domain-containing protein [Streptomyces tateyamensis]PYC78874.1 DUF4383 domain-containing protein [Streptomyces tateyamensis]